MNQLRPARTSAQKWFESGLQEAELFKTAWRKAREHVMRAGFFFIRARESCPNGDWSLFVQAQSGGRISERTVRLYMQLAEAALVWARMAEPQTAGGKLEEVATKEVMMMSPKPLVALLRDLREMRPFGEYDAVKYAQRRLGNGQLEFELDFEKAFASVDVLDRLGSPGFTLNFPEGKSEEEGLTELREKMKSVLAKIDAQLGKETIDV